MTNMSISEIDPLTDQRWEDFALGHPAATVFHTTAWLRVLRATYGFRPRYLVQTDAAGRITAGMPFVEAKRGRLVGLPFSDFCAPLTTGAGEVPFEDLGRAGVRDVTSIEVRGDGGIGLEAKGFVKGPRFLHHVIPLDADAGTLLKRAGHSPRYNARKAEANGVRARVGRTLEDVRTFYELMVMTRRNSGLFPSRAASSTTSMRSSSPGGEAMFCSPSTRAASSPARCAATASGSASPRPASRT